MAIKDLKKLLKKMEPKLAKGEFVFCSVSEKKMRALELKSVLEFKEKEGVTLVLEKKTADANALEYSGVWALITLSVYSDLNAVGLLAKVTGALARAGIPANLVSAYHHDHVFVPRAKAKKALKALEVLSQ
ncbi:MAG: ACT domain-containing protein [Candidatus Micrarchaeota archaeon]